MSSLPAHLVPAIRARRIAAGVLNLSSVGLLLSFVRSVTAESHRSTPGAVSGSLFEIGLLTVLWLFCILNRKSMGAVFCVLEIRGIDGAAPTIKQMVLRSGPIYLLALVTLFPPAVLPSWIEPARMVIGVLLLLTLITSWIIGLTTRSSLLDRLSSTVVLQLNLPDHAKPRVRVIRIV